MGNMDIGKTGNLTRFGRHMRLDSLHEDFRGDFGFRQEGSRFSVLQEREGAAGVDEVFCHVQMDSRLFFGKLIGLEMEFPGLDGEALPLHSYRSSVHYRSHLHEYFHWTAAQHHPAPPLEGECQVFFNRFDELIVWYRVRNVSRAAVPVKWWFWSMPAEAAGEAVSRVTDDGFLYGAVQKVATAYRAWMRVTAVSGDVRFRSVPEGFRSDAVEDMFKPLETREWMFRCRFGTGDAEPEAVGAAVSPARALAAAIRRTGRTFAALPALTGADQRFEPLVLRAAGILSSNRLQDYDARGKSVMTIQAGKCGVGATWWWDSATHMPGLGLCGDRETVRGAVHLLLGGVGADGQPPVRYLGPLGYHEGVQMPILAWGILQAGISTPDPALLRKAYPALSRYAGWWMQRRTTCGLVTLPGGCTAQDDSPRWSSEHPIDWSAGKDWRQTSWGESRNADFACPDVNAHLYLELRALERMAKVLGREEEASAWRKQAARLGRDINRHLFDPETGMYQDLHLPSGTFTGYLTAGCFLPIYAGLATKQQGQAACRRYLLDPRHFYTRLPFAGVDRAHPAFRSGGRLHEVPQFPGALVQSAYWLGRVWLQYSYWLTGALWQAGLRREADAAADAVLDVLLPQESLYECYDPLTAEGNGHAEFSWGAAPVLALAYRLYRQGPLGPA